MVQTVSRQFIAICLVACCLVSIAANPLNAQQQANTVQLPTFSFFSVSTSVLVPDSGRAYLGGIGRTGSGRSSGGHLLMRNQGMGNFGRATAMSVTAQVHDFRWIDEMLLGNVTVVEPQQDERGIAGRSELAQQLAGENRSNPPAAAGYGAMHVNAIRNAQAAKQAAKNKEAMEYVARAQAKREEGKLQLAQYYLKLAKMKAAGETLDKVELLLREINYDLQKVNSGGGR